MSSGRSTWDTSENISRWTLLTRRWYEGQSNSTLLSNNSRTIRRPFNLSRVFISRFESNLYNQLPKLSYVVKKGTSRIWFWVRFMTGLERTQFCSAYYFSCSVLPPYSFFANLVTNMRLSILTPARFKYWPDSSLFITTFFSENTETFIFHHTYSNPLLEPVMQQRSFL